MTSNADPRLQLAPPDGRAAFWLFAIAFVLPVLITAVALLAAVLGGGPLKLIGASLPLTLAVTLGGIALLCAALWWLLARLLRRQRLELSADALDVRSSFYRCRIALRELKLEQARVVDLDEHTALKPMLKLNGFSIPGFRSGWFLLRDRRRCFVAIADGQRKLWLPGSGKHDLLLEPRDPAALLAHLRELAAASGRR